MAEEKISGPMTGAQLLSIIEACERDSLGSPVAAGAAVGMLGKPAATDMTTLEIDRYESINAYYARPIGNEEAGRSSIVIPEIRDTVEWEVPQLMEIFASGPPCVFDPMGPDDVEEAQVQTEAVHHVFTAMNNGLLVIHDMIKDARMLRNGYCQVILKDIQVTEVTRYSGLTEIEMAMVLSEKADEKLEILEQRSEQVDAPLNMQAQDPSQVRPAPLTVYDLKVRRTKTEKRICVEPEPPEEMYISSRTSLPGLDGSDFVMRKTAKTRSSLIEEGYDRAKVEEAPTSQPAWQELVPLARALVTDQLAIENRTDVAMQTVEVRDITMKVDYDGDGIAELRHIVLAGKQILENEEIEEMPHAAIVAARMPHRHTGLSAYDDLIDLQLVKTELVRDSLDGMRLAIRGRVAIDYQNCAEEDLLEWRDNGIVRTKGPPQNAIFPFQHPTDAISQALPMIEWLENQREWRTGIGKDSVTLDAEALQNVTKGGQLAALEASQLKTKLKARLIAEGLKDVYLKIHRLLVRHQDQPLQFQLRGKWVTVDPTQWRSRERMNAVVGLGTGSRESKRADIMLLGQAQEKLSQFGVVGPKQAFRTFTRLCQLLGEESPEQYAMDPDSQEFQQYRQQNPPQPAPQVVAAQARLKAVETQTAARQAESQATERATAARAQAEIAHEALQSQQDREHALAANDAAMWQTLIKTIGQIVAQQLKQDPGANAGQVLADDFQTAARGVE